MKYLPFRFGSFWIHSWNLSPVPGLLLLAACACSGQEGSRLVAAKGNGSNDWVYVSSAFSSNTLLTLEASADMRAWRTLGTFHDALFPYPDLSTPEHLQQFYRLKASSRGPTNDWKNQALFPKEPFRGSQWVDIGYVLAEGELGWVKFAILLEGSDRVYYQDSKKYPFHYDFARARLPQFASMDSSSFDAVSLFRTNQQVVLGNLLYPLGRFPHYQIVPEYGVQFVGFDSYTPDEISRWLALVKASVFSSNDVDVFYMPTFEQRQMAVTNSGAFASRGIAVASVDRWVPINNCYAKGWALGRLKYFPGQEVVAAFTDGRLRPEDVLLVDGVPAETPLVAGIITLSPSMPGSHTALLSQSFGIPFVYLSEPGERARVQELVGRMILLRATTTTPEYSLSRVGSAVIRVVDMEGKLSPEIEAELLAARRPRPIQYKPKRSYGALSASTDTLVPDDIQFFGGKAANYGFLRRAVRNNCPVAIAFSFDLWDSFLDQTLPNSKSLRAEVSQRLAAFTNYPPDMALLRTSLAGIRDLFTKTARFTPAQQEAIIAALAPHFNANRKIRFRSSTNVEDSEFFTGAGLYDSYSGCLADELDGNTTGPCACDPSESEERGVFRAIQKVYASFYNDNAFLERLAHGVDETEVAMGILVHHSFPDEDELANGVGNVQVTFFPGPPPQLAVRGDTVTQLGAVSVTNPDGRSTPEIVAYGDYFSIFYKQYSSLVPLGQYVLTKQEYNSLYGNLFAPTAQEFYKHYPSKRSASLKFEYKKDRNLGLVVKQVRELPAGPTNQVIAFLVNDSQTFRVAQKEWINAFWVHRLKSLLTLKTINARLASSNLVDGIYTEGTFQYVQDGVIHSLTGPLSSWPDAVCAANGRSNYWTTGVGPDQRSWVLQTDLITSVSGDQPMVFTQADYPKKLSLSYPTPNGTATESVDLEPMPHEDEAGALQTRTIIKTNVTIETSFYWSRPSVDFVAGYTASLLRFRETRITGLTTIPISLVNYFSQTYGPGHHNMTESFLFEPRLEPGIAPSTLRELQSHNIKVIHYSFVREGLPATSRIFVIGFDDQSREL